MTFSPKMNILNHMKVTHFKNLQPIIYQIMVEPAWAVAIDAQRRKKKERLKGTFVGNKTKKNQI